MYTCNQQIQLTVTRKRLNTVISLREGWRSKLGNRRGERIGLQKFVFPQVVNTTPGTNPKADTPHNLFSPVLHHPKEKHSYSAQLLGYAGGWDLLPAHKADAGGWGPHTWGRSRAPPPAGRPTPHPWLRTVGDRHLRTGAGAGPFTRLATPARPFPVCEAWHSSYP